MLETAGTNRAERCAKSYATVRKNFLFHDTVSGARLSAIIYSLTFGIIWKNMGMCRYDTSECVDAWPVVKKVGDRRQSVGILDQSK